MVANWIYYIGVLIVAFIVALFFDDSRDWLEDAWSYIKDFEWWEDLKDLLGSSFEGLGEFSMYGLVFGIVSVVVLYLLSSYTLAPFLAYYSATGKILWGGITYVGTFIAGYLMGKHFENTA